MNKKADSDEKVNTNVDIAPNKCRGRNRNRAICAVLTTLLAAAVPIVKKEAAKNHRVQTAPAINVFSTPETSYERACERSRKGDLSSAWKWLKEAMKNSSDEARKRLADRAYHDPDFQALWSLMEKEWPQYISQ